MSFKKIVQIATLVASAFAAGTFYMEAHTFNEKLDKKKHDRELKDFVDDLKKIPDLSPNFNPKIDTEIKDFDFIMNLEIDENSGLRNFNSTISKYDVGQYKLSSTPDGKAILKLMEFKLNDIISSNNIVIKIKARGTADGIRVRSDCYYDGQLGDYLRIKYFRYNMPQQELLATFISGQTLMQNEYFALLRAYDVVSHLKSKYPVDASNIKIFVQEFNEQGPEYRRCDLSITIEKAFLEEYNELNRVTKFIVKEF
jgi:hypothetical protein